MSLKTLINKRDIRKILGENAFNICKDEYNTLYTGYKLVNYINSITKKHIGFYLPSLVNSGGIYVILKHASILKEIGWDVDLIIPKGDIDLFTFENQIFNVINLKNCVINSQYDIMLQLFLQHCIQLLIIIKQKNIYILYKVMKLIFIHMEIIIDLLQKKLITQILILNILLYQNGVKVGCGKNIKKNLDMHQMVLISIISVIIDVI